jgi:selenoprotein W-related protein
LADAITQNFGLEPELIGGGGGVFDVHADKSLIFSKHQSGRFPDHQEILESIQQSR